MSFKEFLNERKNKLTWDNIHRWANTYHYSGSKKDFVERLLGAVMRLSDKQVRKQLDNVILKNIFMNSEDKTLLGLSNVLGFRKDFEDSPMDVGNWQQMLLQTIAQYKRDNEVGSMYEAPRRLTWKSLSYWAQAGSRISGSKQKFIERIILRIKNGVDKQVDKLLDYDVIKKMLENADDDTLLGLSNVLSYKRDFEDSSFKWGNWQEMLLQTVAQYKRDNGAGSMYEGCEYDEETTDLKMQIDIELSELSDEELDEFGSVLHGEFFDEDDEFEDDVYTREDIDVMIAELGEEFFEDILDMLEEIEDLEEKSINHEIKMFFNKALMKKNYMMALDHMKISGKNAADSAKIFKGVDARELQKMYDGMIAEDIEDLEEAVSRRMKAQNRNRKKRKFMQTSRAELRRTKQKRKIQARKSKQSRKRYYRANKNKIKNYQKSRADAIKKGTHKVKVRRKA
jgi:hypothetical protein